MYPMLDRFRSTLLPHGSLAADDPRLLLENSGDLAMYYAPFDYIERRAQVVLVGITPGAAQARAALQALASALRKGMSDDDAMRQAKSTASFSGPLRANLVAMLDSIGLHRKLGVASCSEVFSDGGEGVHFTSALRYPVFLNGQNYSGTPSIASSPFLVSITDRWLREEATALREAMWIPLGKEPTAALGRLVRQGLLKTNQVLEGLPHPSGANAERIAYFLGKKQRQSLSRKTNPDLLDLAKKRLMRTISCRGEY